MMIMIHIGISSSVIYNIFIYISLILKYLQNQFTKSNMFMFDLNEICLRNLVEFSIKFL